MEYQYRFDSSVHHASRCFVYDDPPQPIAITDLNPHLVWCDTHQYVILQIQTDGSLYIFTNDNSVTKIPSSVYTRSDFDFRDFLSEEHSVSTFAKPDKYSRCLTVDESDPEFGAATQYGKQYRSLIGEFRDKTNLAQNSKDLETIHRRSLKDDSETNPIRRFTFRNFDEPNKEFLDCWYHPSNQWKLERMETFMCYKTSCNVIIVNIEPTFPPTGVMIRPPLPHQCGINIHLADNSLSRFLFKCPSTFTLSSDPENPVVRCKPYLTYLTTPVTHLLPKDELDSLMVDVLITYARAWNMSHYRCRLDFDNRKSAFWTAMSIEERTLEVLKYPTQLAHTLTVTNQYRAALNYPLLDHLIYDTHLIDYGYHLLSTVITTKPGDYDHFDIATLPDLVFSFVDDMDARDRGFAWYYRHHNYIIYQNVREDGIFAIGNLKTNVFIDFRFNDGVITRAWRRFEHVVRQHVVSGNTDLRPIIQQEHPEVAKFFTIPGTDVTVHPGEEYPFKPKTHRIEWTPVIITCHQNCVPPKTLYQFSYNQAKLRHGTIKGVKRSITIRNDFFNNLVRHDISHVCTATYAHRWKISKYGPVTFLMCGSLVDEFNTLDFNNLDRNPDGPRTLLTLSFITFSPTYGLCGFSPGMVHQFVDGPPSLQDESDPKTCSLPQWSCSPGCRTPHSIRKLKIHDSAQYRAWLSELALNVYKLKYFHSEPTTFKCTINPHAEWRVFTKGRYQTFFCNNFAMFGLNFRLPIFHPKRWIMAYCFTEEELRSLPWTKTGKYWTATLTNAIVTRQKKQFPLYSVYWLPSRDFCVFHLGRLGMAQPILDSHSPGSCIYRSHFEADAFALETLLTKSRMDTITSSTLESMVIKVLQTNRALEYDLLKSTLQLQGQADPNPETEEWKNLRDRFAAALTLDPSLTPEASQSEYGVDDGVDNGVDTVNTVFSSDDEPMTFRMDLNTSRDSNQSSL